MFQANVTVRTARTSRFYVVYGKRRQLFLKHVACAEGIRLFVKLEVFRRLERKVVEALRIEEIHQPPIWIYRNFTHWHAVFNVFSRFHRKNVTSPDGLSTPHVPIGIMKNCVILSKSLENSRNYGGDCRLLQFYVRRVPLNLFSAGPLIHPGRRRPREKPL